MAASKTKELRFRIVDNQTFRKVDKKTLAFYIYRNMSSLLSLKSVPTILDR